MVARRKPVEMPAGDGGSGSVALAVLTEDTPAGGVLLRVAPGDLDVDVNVRSDLGLTPEFVASVGEHLLQPPLVYRDAVGRLRVLVGHRRVVAAVEAGVERIEVRVVDAPGDDWQRIRDQLTENDHRAPLSAADRARAYQQAALLGRSAASIAREVHRPVAEVEQALAVVASPEVLAIVQERPGIPMDLAAGLTELVDEPAVSAQVVAVLEKQGAGAATHELQRARDRREAVRVLAEARTVWEGRGYAVATTWNETDRWEALSSLTAQPGEGDTPGPRIESAEHEACPHRAVKLDVVSSGEDEPTARVALEYCTDWKRAGHYKRYASASSGATSGPRSEEEKAERRALVANNRAMESASKVRREWTAQLLQRPARSFPRDAVQVACTILAHLPGWKLDAHAGLEAIGHPDLRFSSGRKSLETRTALASPHKAAVWLLASVIAETESTLAKDFWRDPSTAAVLLLEALAGWGYPLADVEQLAVDTLRKPKRKGRGR